MNKEGPVASHSCAFVKTSSIKICIMKYNIGDWVYYDFELCQIKEMEDGKVYSVTTGVINTTGFDMADSIYPLSMELKVISEGVAHYSKRLHDIKGANLNFPDIHRELVRRWHQIIENKSNGGSGRKLWDSLSAWVSTIESECMGVRQKTIDSVKIFR
jgi:hypothetical protein